MADSKKAVLIDPVRLHTLLGEARDRYDVVSVYECESTSSLLLQRAEMGAPSGSVIVADRQTAGRGSRGRSWAATPESSLTFSLLWRFECELFHLAGLSLAVGVAVVHALEACGASGVSLKWPNDILYKDGKLGGILVDVQSDDDSSFAVIGIGLNLRVPENVEPTDFALPPAALDGMLSQLPERHDLFAKLLVELVRVHDQFAQGGFAALRTEWQAHNAWQDRPVRLLREGGVEKEGICRGADDDGALLVETAAGIERCLSGDLSMRAL